MAELLDASGTDRVDLRSWKERVVVVCDPVRFTRRLTVDILRNAGAERVTAAETPEAARWFVKEARDAVLVAGWREKDDLPGCGPELVRALRRDPKPRRTPSLILTERRALIDVEQVRDSGADALALRPVSPAGLAERLTEITERPRPFVKTVRFAGPDRRAKRPMRGEFKRDRDVADGHVTPVAAALNQARAIIFESLRRQDPLSARVGRSLERFLDGREAVDPAAREIIDLHRGALAQLADLRRESLELRLDVVAGLERIVARRAAA
ncbi:MAG: response regulator [Oceanicaulis sp.]